MSRIALSIAKEFLDVFHSSDDAKLQMLLDAAEDEALQYMNRDDLNGPWEAFAPLVGATGESTLPPSVVLGVMLFLQAAYQASPEDMTKLRAAGEIKLHPQRILLGA